MYLNFSPTEFLESVMHKCFWFHAVHMDSYVAVYLLQICILAMLSTSVFLLLKECNLI